MIKIYWKWILALVILSGCILVWSIYFFEDKRGKLDVTFLDVGQGDAIFIVSPSGRRVLIDGGPDNMVLRELGRELPFYDKRIDIVLATHSDNDHIGGISSVVDRYEVSLFVEPLKKSAEYSLVEDALIKKGVSTTSLFAGSKIDLGGGARLDILFPSPTDKINSSGDNNSSSYVAALSYGKEKYLLMGDAPGLAEQKLVEKYGRNLKVQVLKVGHHGSDTSTSENFLFASTPHFAVISSGKGNKFGHPSKMTVGLLEKHGAKILNTALLGPLRFETDGEKTCLISQRGFLTPSSSECTF